MPDGVDAPAVEVATAPNSAFMIDNCNVVHAVDRFGPVRGVITHSFGGQVAALALEGGPPIGRRIETDRLVVVACPHSLQRLTRNFGRSFNFSAELQARFESRISEAAGRSIETVNTGTLLAAAGIPVLALHDGFDDEVPFSAAEAMATTGAGISLIAFAGLGHRRIIVTSAVIRAAIKFLQ